jgi:hypothetical protein
VPERVVHKLEIVEIDEQNSDPRPISGVAPKFALEPFKEQSANGEASQRIMRRCMHQLSDRAAQTLDFRTGPCGK